MSMQDTTEDEPTGPGEIDLRYIWRQFIRDIYDKETQSAATYSYMWIADQVGHIGVGMLLYLLAAALDVVFAGWTAWLAPAGNRLLLYCGLLLVVMVAYEIPTLRAFARDRVARSGGSLTYREALWREVRNRAGAWVFVYALLLWYLLSTGLELSDAARANLLFIALFIPAFWEYRSYKDSAHRHNGRFPLDRLGLTRNAVTATWYMWIGALLGFGFHIGGGTAVVMFLAMLLAAVSIAPWWLRQKIIWQKAALPYLSRLGTVDCPITDDRSKAQQIADRIQQEFVDAICRDDGPPRQLIVCGPLQAARTPLVAAIGTELCFRRQMVRYLNFDKLLEMIHSDDRDPRLQPVYSGPDNIVYWCWRDCRVLVIDDINTALLPTLEDNLESFKRISSQQLTPASTQALKDLAEFKECHTVWVIGDVDDPGEWVKFIAEICGSDPASGPIVVELTARVGTADGHSTVIRNSAPLPL